METPILTDEVDEMCLEFENFTKSFYALSARVEKRIALLKSLEEERKRQDKRIEENVAKVQDKIKLDVGGTVFATSKATLLSQKNTYFSAMLSSGRWQPDKDDTYFIDANPKHFDRILDFLRSGEFSWKDLTPSEIKKLEKDLDYFQIIVPNRAPAIPQIIPPPTLKWDTHQCGSNLEISPDKAIVTKTKGNWEWNAAVLGDAPVTKFSVKVINRGADGSIMIGFSTPNGFDLNGKNHSTLSHSVCAFMGNMYGPNRRKNIRLGDVKNGSVVTVEYNEVNKKISFSVDGSTPVVGHDDVTGPLYPALDIHDLNASLSFVT